MPAERLKLFATLTSERGLWRRGRTLRHGLRAAISIAALGLWLTSPGTPVAPTPASAAAPCGAPGEMVQKGLDAYAQSRYELAMPSFECVLRTDDGLQKLHAEFFLARIHSDDTGGFVDHARAYALFQGISEQADAVDPDDSRRAPFVAKAVTAIAGYVRRGLPEIGLKADPERAVEYYRQAATFFNEPDAQFEMAKLHLAGVYVPKDVPLGLHYIQNLVQANNAPAQAFMAEQHWRGSYAPQIAKDRSRALAMSKLAVENAGPSDRLWIEDSYQNIYCATPAVERSRAAAMAAAWRRAYLQTPNAERAPQAQKSPQAPMALGRRQPALSRTCSNGDPVDMELRSDIAAPPVTSSLTQNTPQPTTPAGMRAPPR